MLIQKREQNKQTNKHEIMIIILIQFSLIDVIVIIIFSKPGLVIIIQFNSYLFMCKLNSRRGQLQS
jgi:hypothetical protein